MDATTRQIKRGDIYLYNFGTENKGSLQSKRRAVIWPYNKPYSLFGILYRLTTGLVIWLICAI